MSDKMKSKDLSKKITKEYMDEAFHAHELGKLVGYTTAISPVEIFVAHDIVPIYPENHAVACLTSRMGTELSGLRRTWATRATSAPTPVRTLATGRPARAQPAVFLTLMCSCPATLSASR